MKVLDLMMSPVQTAHPDDSLTGIVEAFADAHITAVPVVDQHDRILGVVSTSDILTARAESQLDDESWGDQLVEEVMTRPVITIPPDASVMEAAQRMLYAEVHRLFVVDGERLVGVISQTDLVRAFAAHRLRT